MTSISTGERPRAHRMSTITAVLATLLAGIWQWREHRRAWRQLAAMSDRELQDIGVCRADVAHHYWRCDKGKLHWLPGVQQPQHSGFTRDARAPECR